MGRLRLVVHVHSSLGFGLESRRARGSLVNFLGILLFSLKEEDSV